MERYTLSKTITINHTKGITTETPEVDKHPEGEWVKYDDVCALLNNLGHSASVVGFHDRIKRLENADLQNNLIKTNDGLINLWLEFNRHIGLHNKAAQGS